MTSHVRLQSVVPAHGEETASATAHDRFGGNLISRGSNATHDLAAIMGQILRAYTLPLSGYHGVVHWARVLENGLRISDVTPVDREVVTLFALFHDSRRINEHRDQDHGLRGGELALSLRGSLVHVTDHQFDLLFEACRLHTDGYTVGDPTLLECWDADRLDLGRVGITPEPHRLCTDVARDLLPWAHERATRGHAPIDVLIACGVSDGVDFMLAERVKR